jgi:hypothetical protein
VNQSLSELDNGWQIENTEHSAIYQIAKPFLLTRFNTLHTRISYHFAITLLETIDGNPIVVIPAILLHDIGWSAIPETQLLDAFGPEIKKPELWRLHETEGARLAGEILRNLKFPEEQVLEIQNIISGHDSRSAPINISDGIVKDADKLWRYTHEGFTIDYQRYKKSKLEHLIWLVDCMPNWFINRTAMILAHNEALRRKQEHGIELVWQSPQK